MENKIKCYCGHTTYCDCSPIEIIPNNMNITTEKVLNKLEKNYGWENLHDEVRKDIIKDTISVINDILKFQKGISIKGEPKIKHEPPLVSVSPTGVSTNLPLQKLTAVEWLDEQLQDKMFIEYGYYKGVKTSLKNGVRKIVISIDDYMELKQQAKEMEKEQIKEAMSDGQMLNYQSV